MLRARPCQEIVAAFGHQLEREIRPHAIDQGQIFSKEQMKRFANIKGQTIRLPAPSPRRSLTIRLGRLLAPSNGIEFLENRLDLDVAGGDLLPIYIVERQRLLQDKQMLRSVMAG